MADTNDIDRHTPAKAASREEIIAAAHRLKGLGLLEWAEFNQEGRQLFVLSYCPYSGRAATHVHWYYYDGVQWIRYGERLIYGTHMVAAELPPRKEQLVLRGADGSVVLTESLSKVERRQPAGQ